jgi:hypothetical protein
MVNRLSPCHLHSDTFLSPATAGAVLCQQSCVVTLITMLSRRRGSSRPASHGARIPHLYEVNGGIGLPHPSGAPYRYARLERAKADWDPQNLLRFNKNIEPAEAV